MRLHVVLGNREGDGILAKREDVVERPVEYEPGRRIIEQHQEDKGDENELDLVFGIALS